MRRIKQRCLSNKTILAAKLKVAAYYGEIELKVYYDCTLRIVSLNARVCDPHANTSATHSWPRIGNVPLI